jgi:hypothetical protein
MRGSESLPGASGACALFAMLLELISARFVEAQRKKTF